MYAVAYTAHNRLLSIMLVIDQIRFLSYELILLHCVMKCNKGTEWNKKTVRFSFLVKPFVKVHVIFPSDGTEN